MLVDRVEECARIEQLLVAAAGGTSGVLLLHGDAGIGKTALLEWATERARQTGMQIAHVAGVEAESDFGFAALHQLLGPLLPSRGTLPAPQRHAIETVLGLDEGPAPDRFVVGLAALTLLTDAAARRPLLCVVDDAQWLDHPSGELLGFVARRLRADRVVMLVALRPASGSSIFDPGTRTFVFRPSRDAALSYWDDLPRIELGGLPDLAAAELLASVAGRTLPDDLRRRIVADGAGNPLALFELATDVSDYHGEEAGRPFRPTGPLSERYRARIAALPEDTQTLLLVASISLVGDPERIWQAAELLGVDRAAVVELALDQFVSWGPPVRFRHPLLRSAAYYAASAQARRAAHEALAAVSDAEAQADRRAWHRAEAATGPDEDIASELLRSAEQAVSRGGVAAGAAFLERAAELTPDAGRRGQRLLRAAEARLLAGGLESARELLSRASSELVEPIDRGRARRLQGIGLHAAGDLRRATSTLLEAAAVGVTIDRAFTVDTLLDAIGAAWLGGELGSTMVEARRLLALAPAAGPVPRPAELLLDSVAALAEHRTGEAAALLRRVLFAGAGGELPAELIGRFYPITLAVNTLHDPAMLVDLEHRVVGQLRRRGALADLVPALVTVAYFQLLTGRFSAAASSVAEARALADATSFLGGIDADAELTLYAYRGEEDGARVLADQLRPRFSAQGNVFALGLLDRAVIILELGLGNYEQALRQALAAPPNDFSVPAVRAWDVVEAATRSGETAIAEQRLEELASSVFVSAGTPFALGVLARARGLVAGEDDEAEPYYERSLEHLSETPYLPETARTRLLYGEWLRRRRRRRQARDELRRAAEIFHRLGMTAFARRTDAELLATGEHAAPRREVAPAELLTPQESQIALLAAQGHTNREIASKLFVSAATVDFHLRKVYRKLGVTSRVQLSRLMLEPDPPAGAGGGAGAGGDHDLARRGRDAPDHDGAPARAEKGSPGQDL
jgi:DNA-binding CsgD family transcriptional regulator